MHLLLSTTMRLSTFLFFFALQLSFGTPFQQQVSSHFSRIPKKIFVPPATPAVSTHSWSRRSISSTSLDTLRWPLCGLEQGRLIQKKVTDISTKWRPLLRRLRRWTRRTVVAAALFLVISLTSADPAIARSGIRSGGRMGGSFGAPTRAPVMRSIPRSYPRRSHQPRMIIHRGPQIHLHSPSSSQYSIGDSARLSRAYAAPARRVSLSDVALVTGVGAVVSLNVIDKLQQRSGNSRGLESPLGPGVSVLSTTLAINVPDRDSPNSILDRLSRLALIARTDTRKGVQDLISETSLEVLRQKDYIVSVDSRYCHFSRASDAQREFNQLSIGGRSKFDQETVSNFGGKANSEKNPYAVVDAYPRATIAVVTINLCIEGDSTKITKIKNRIELHSALSRIASDCQVGDCLLSAEVLWSPESRTERITSEDIYANYPSLFPLLD